MVEDTNADLDIEEDTEDKDKADVDEAPKKAAQ